MITDQAIQRVMDDTGMERVQAHRHLQQRATLQQRDRESRRAAANAAVARHATETAPFRSFGDIARGVVADVAERMK